MFMLSRAVTHACVVSAPVCMGTPTTTPPPSPKSPPSRRLVRLVALEADAHERTALRALVYGPDCIHGYALRERLRVAIAKVAP
jgi:hypothetical protein